MADTAKDPYDAYRSAHEACIAVIEGVLNSSSPLTGEAIDELLAVQDARMAVLQSLIEAKELEFVKVEGN